jgi:protein tyrosine phosphatase (PTP) superfamily phosphohydrolase (DUF442 family)
MALHHGSKGRSLVPCLAVAVAAAISACDSTRGGGGGERRSPKQLPPVARPMAKVDDPYAAAAVVTLLPQAPIERDGLLNVYKLSPDVISGSEPEGDAAWSELAAMGVKTIVSVDGKVPNADRAARYGMRYVHIPIEYKGISDEELLQLTKTFRELDGPFYLHCFHGKHRGPAAAAVARLTLDGASREQALAEMRQWCGTAGDYPGLYRDIATKPLPTERETADYPFTFPARRQFAGFRLVMVDVPRRHDALLRLSKRDWAPDPAHPDVDAANEATKLAEDFAGAELLADPTARPPEFRALLAAAVDQSAKLAAILPTAKGDAGALARSKTLLNDLTKSCTACHDAFRNQ